MAKLIEVQLGEYRAVGKCDLNNIDCKRNDVVVLEVERGSEIGRVVSDVERACDGKLEGVQGKVLRVATEGDLRQIENNRMKAKDAKNVCIRKVAERRLEMRIVKSEYSFDNSKIIFYFTAEGRVDFRALVKDLAKIFRVRIELKQIGVRDKAKIVGGYGVCGRELCCSAHLKTFHSLGIKMAKEQNLPLNPSKINGLCGRIKCCMAYEFSVYKEFSKELPRMGQKVTTPQGKGRVTSVNILKRLIDVDLGEGKTTRLVYTGENEN